MLGAGLYVLASFAAEWKILALFVACFCVIASMYGGGFATIPAYLADMFGTQFVGAIHGRLLTAWSTAGILGPVVVNYLHDTRLAEGIAPDQIYGPIFYILAGMLVVGFVANLLVRPVNPKWHMSEAEVSAEQAKLRLASATAETGSFGIGKGGLDAKAAPSGCSLACLLLGVSGRRSRRLWCCSTSEHLRPAASKTGRRTCRRLECRRGPVTCVAGLPCFSPSSHWSVLQDPSRRVPSIRLEFRPSQSDAPDLYAHLMRNGSGRPPRLHRGQLTPRDPNIAPNRCWRCWLP